MVLGDDLLAAFVVDDKVLHIIQQLGFGAQALQKTLDAATLIADLVAADFLFFILRAQPVEEMLPLGTQAAQARLDAVAEHAEGIAEKQLRNVRLVVAEVVIVGGTQFDAGVLQLDEHQRQAVDIQKNIGAAVGGLGIMPVL